jgi:spore germination protein YaaH/PKD repeat protein
MKLPRRLLSILFLFFICHLILAQSERPQKSFVQQQAEEYAKYNLNTEQQWDSLNNVLNPSTVAKKHVQKSHSRACNLNKIVFGWHPYWNGTTYYNYDWSLLSDVSYFSYEVDYSTGNAISTHGWSTTALVDSAQAHGVRVNLGVTLFANHATFLTSSVSKQTLISNLISLVQARNANGVNIDFEGLPASQAANFTAFMIDLCNQMHAAVSGSQVSIALYSVDWSNVFDEAALNPYVDLFIIMGYDYYYSSSSQAGPTDPLYALTTGYNYCLTKSTTYYLAQGISPNKLALGLPYYGPSWPTDGNTVPSNTTGSGSSVLYNTVRNNTNGYYSNKLWNNTSFAPYYAYQIGAQWHECFCDDDFSLGRRYDMVNQRGIAGIGIWALGYDDGYTELWDELKDKFTSCAVVQCTDSIFDMGGPERNYYDKENYSFTIAPTGASFVSLDFTSFSTELNYDTLWLYDGPSTTSPLIGVYSGTNNPGTVNSSGNSLTVKFKSDNATNAAGWRAIWNCTFDNVDPVTTITAPNNWITHNFTATFNDSDNVGGSGIQKSFYQVLENNNNDWGANASRGFFADNFDTLKTSVWTVPVGGGNWSCNGGMLIQSDTSIGNTNIYASLNQELSNRYLYQFSAKVGSGTYSTYQRRFGFHFFCDTANSVNRNNSYFIFFRVETNQLEFYKVVNDVFTQEKVVTGVITNPNQLYDYKVFYDRITGLINVYRDDVLLGSWTDPSPYSTGGNYVSFRTGNSHMWVSELKVFRSHASSVNITVGAGVTNDIRTQNINPTTFGAKIKSICNDVAGNLSAIAYHDLNIDFTPPTNIASVNDGTGTDIDTVVSANSLSANWTASADPNSDIASYWYAIGDSPGDSNLVMWTNNALSTAVTANGLSLINGITYYMSVRAVNGAGLLSSVSTSDGQYVAMQPDANFISSSTTICAGDTVHFINTSSFANTVLWNFAGGNPSTSPIANPDVVYNTSGNYAVQLIADGIGGYDTLTSNNYVHVQALPVASFTVTDTLIFLPGAIATFMNTSTGADHYFWNFGDGNTSTDQNPWHAYDTTGYYDVTLIVESDLCGTDTFIFHHIHVSLPLGTEEYSSDPTVTVYPNPFNNSTTLTYSLTTASEVEISLFDVLSCEISILASSPQQA